MYGANRSSRCCNQATPVKGDSWNLSINIKYIPKDFGNQVWMLDLCLAPANRQCCQNFLRSIWKKKLSVRHAWAIRRQNSRVGVRGPTWHFLTSLTELVLMRTHARFKLINLFRTLSQKNMHVFVRKSRVQDSFCQLPWEQASESLECCLSPGCEISNCRAPGCLEEKMGCPKLKDQDLGSVFAWFCCHVLFGKTDVKPTPMSQYI